MSHLILIIDCHPSFFLLNSETTSNTNRPFIKNDHPQNFHPFYNYLDQIQFFINLYLSLDAKNHKVSILALFGPESHPKWVAQGLCNKSIDEIRAIFREFFTKVTSKDLGTSFENTDSNSNSNGRLSRQHSMNDQNDDQNNFQVIHSEFSKIAVALGMGLAFLNKQQIKKNVDQAFKKEQSGGTNSQKNSSTSTNANNDDNKNDIISATCRSSSSNLEGRILLISNLSTHNLQYQYMNLINSAYCAKEHQVIIDILTIEYIDPVSKRQKVFVSKQTSQNIQAIFGQIVEVVDGIYQHCNNLSQLFHFLNNCFLSSSTMRQKLISYSSQARVDYRAASFDTGQLVDVGFVCSICLAVYEHFSPVCGSCGNLAKIDFGTGIS